jgi:hypothetical protein
MAEEEPDDRAEWLLAPPKAGEIRLMVELGEGAELTPEMRAAVETLMRELNESEVEGYAMPGAFSANIGLFGAGPLQGSCQQLVCERHDCSKHSCDKYKSNLRLYWPR